MKSNELRLGNLFIDEKTKTIINVIGLTEQYITFSGHFKNHWQAKPIEITEEWLLKFGFISYGKLNPTYRLNPFIVELSILGKHYNFRKIMNKEESVLLKEIKYVHQLQNIYFSLTEKELTV